MGSGELEDPKADPPAAEASPETSPVLTQAGWRKMGAVTLGSSALMAWYAAVSGVLRQTVAHAAALLSEEAAVTSDGPSGLFCLAYWCVFFLLIAATMYVAILDVRFIRLQFLLEQRQVFDRTFGERAPKTPRRDSAGDNH